MRGNIGIPILLLFSIAFLGCANTGSELPKYSMTYLGNGNTGGTAPADSGSYLSGATVTVLGNTGNLTKTAYLFDGWNTESDGSGTSYQAGESIAMGSSDITLYAAWANLPRYAIVYEGNGKDGGSVPTDEKTYLAGDSVTVLGNTGNLTRSGYSFAGWNTKADGTGTSYAAGDAMKMGSAKAFLYAQWTAHNPLSVSLEIEAGATITLTAASTVAWGSTLFVSVSESFSTYAWYLDTILVSGETGSSLSIASSTLSAGSHELAVIVTDANGLLSSANYRFDVTN